MKKVNNVYKVMNNNTGKYVCQKSKFDGKVYVMHFTDYRTAEQFFRALRRTPFTSYTLVTVTL
jgi:hypothetical protein